MTSSAEFVTDELAEPIDPRVAAMAAALAQKHGSAARAVLFYGSCLRERVLEGMMLDFYLIVSSYREAYGRSWLAAANRLLPPNVFPLEHDGLRAKYAVLSEADFAREMSPAARSVSVWARFAQPARLAWAKDDAIRTRIASTVVEAGRTLFTLTRPTLAPNVRDDSLAIFRAGFALTYGAELRAERRQRSASIVDADPDRYRRLGEAVLAEQGGVSRTTSRRAWRIRQRRGKLLSLARLGKAAFTFAGGADYLAWKINRHAGTQIELKPWQRRWPLVAAITLVPRLIRKGAIR